MASALNIIWSRLMHDLTLYDHRITTEELVHHQFKDENESPEEREERLHTEIAGGLSAQTI